MSDCDPVAAFLDLRRQPSGPEKKAAMLKLFGEKLEEAGFTDTRNMSSTEIEQCIGNGFRESYAADPSVFAHKLLENAKGNVDAARDTFKRFVDAFDPENGHQAAALFAAIQQQPR